MQAQTKNKLSIIALALLFITPVIVAIVLNSNLIKFSPESFKNYGSFIQPPIKITDKQSLKKFEEYWTVIYHHSGDCSADCLKMIDTLYRIRLTKGHKMKKVKLLVLHPENTTIEIPSQYSSIEQQSYAATDNLNKILTELSPLSLGDDKGLYLLAPEGFLMMSYTKDFEPRDVIKDLGLLLRARKNQG
ncbi:MAG: hypothetical protein JKX98_01220 [Alcanivoracaceae bacterium]|nr:hypothetical protein [Alcanivoracaceae bacterium]